MKIAVIGAGLMGRAALYDLTRADDVESVGIFDIDEELAKEVGVSFGSGKAFAGRLDASDQESVTAMLSNYDAAISCVTYRLNPGLTRAAIAAKCHLIDLGGNNDTVQTQLGMNDEAEQAGISVVPDCGLAPGMVSVLVADGFSKLDRVRSIKIRVGGLPQSPRPPLNYQMLFSAEGLINEYWEPVVILEQGKKKTVNPMTEVESLEFDGIGELEAFYTSGGTSTLPDSYLDKVDFLDYKTIRYPGHCKLFRTMLDIGLASQQEIDVNGQKVQPRELFKAVLNRKLSFGDLDMTLVRVTIVGEASGDEKQIVYEIVDRQQSAEGLTAMMRTTSFPASIVALMAARGQLTEPGCKPQEVVVKPSLFISELKKRQINLTVVES